MLAPGGANSEHAFEGTPPSHKDNLKCIVGIPVRRCCTLPEQYTSVPYPPTVSILRPRHALLLRPVGSRLSRLVATATAHRRLEIEWDPREHSNRGTPRRGWRADALDVRRRVNIKNTPPTRVVELPHRSSLPCPFPGGSTEMDQGWARASNT